MDTLEQRLKRQPEIDEIHEIIHHLRGSEGRNDGDYRSKHLATILQYLFQKKRENKAITLQKLALIIGMSQRQIRENYIDGLLAFGVIELNQKCDEWYYVGLSAFTVGEGKLK